MDSNDGCSDSTECHWLVSCIAPRRDCDNRDTALVQNMVRLKPEIGRVVRTCYQGIN